MVWSTALTAVDNAILTASQYNASVRDNLLETAPAKATGAGNWFTVSGVNQISERQIRSAAVSTAEQCTSAQYGDLDTVGPSVTVFCKWAIVFVSARVRSLATTDGRGAYVSVEVSGSNSYAATDDWGISMVGMKANNPNRIGGHLGLTMGVAGTNTFTLKYRCQSGYPPCQFEQRELVVIPF
jgi:hypothetical protein